MSEIYLGLLSFYQCILLSPYTTVVHRAISLRVRLCLIPPCMYVPWHLPPNKCSLIYNWYLHSFCQFLVQSFTIYILNICFVPGSSTKRTNRVITLRRIYNLTIPLYPNFCLDPPLNYKPPSFVVSLTTYCNTQHNKQLLSTGNKPRFEITLL